MGWEIAAAIFFIGTAGIFVYLAMKMDHVILKIALVMIVLFMLAIGFTTNGKIIEANNDTINNTAIVGNLTMHNSITTSYVIFPLIMATGLFLLIVFFMALLNFLRGTIKKGEHELKKDEKAQEDKEVI